MLRLKEESLTLAGDSVSAGDYDGDKNWTFLSYQGKNSGIVAWADPNAPWFAAQGEQVLAMLDTVEWEPAAYKVIKKYAPQQKLCCGAILVICYFAAAGTAAGSAISAASASGCAAAKPCTRPCSRIYLRFLYTPTVRNGTTTTAMPR